MNIRRPLQSSSVLAYSCNPQCLPIQHPHSLESLTHLEASKHPSIPDCRNPLFDDLEGDTLSSRRGPQAVSARRSLSPPPLLALKLVLPPARESQIAHLTGNRHPSIQASEHPGIQASIPPVRGCQMGHLTGNRHPSSQASEHPGIQASRHPGIHASGPEVGGRGGSL